MFGDRTVSPPMTLSAEHDALRELSFAPSHGPAPDSVLFLLIWIGMMNL